MKKILFLLFAAAAFAACNDDDEPKVRYATTNDGIENGYLQGANLHFYGTSTVTDAKGETFTDPEAWFEFAGGPESFSLYMHKTRFAANMPPLEMKIPHTAYTGDGNSIAFSEVSIVPEVNLPNSTGGGYSYQPMPAYTLTEVKGSIDGVNCRVSFICNVPKLGTYRMEYEGKLIIKE